MWQNIQNEFNLNFAAKVVSNEKSNDDADAIRAKDLYSKLYGDSKIVEKIDSIYN
jgi:hypothetical protein